MWQDSDEALSNSLNEENDSNSNSNNKQSQETESIPPPPPLQDEEDEEEEEEDEEDEEEEEEEEGDPNQFDQFVSRPLILEDYMRSRRDLAPLLPDMGYPAQHQHQYSNNDYNYNDYYYNDYYNNNDYYDEDQVSTVTPYSSNYDDSDNRRRLNAALPSAPPPGLKPILLLILATLAALLLPPSVYLMPGTVPKSWRKLHKQMTMIKITIMLWTHLYAILLQQLQSHLHHQLLLHCNLSPPITFTSLLQQYQQQQQQQLILPTPHPALITTIIPLHQDPTLLKLHICHPTLSVNLHLQSSLHHTI